MAINMPRHVENGLITGRSGPLAWYDQGH